MDTLKPTPDQTSLQTLSPNQTTLEPIKINPIEELTKAIGIVHGKEAEGRIRYIVARILEAEEQRTNQAPWTGDRIQRLLDAELDYVDPAGQKWRFVVQERFITDGDHVDHDIDLRLRAEWLGADVGTGNLEIQQSRWWPLSKHMVKTEIIQTALKCVFVAQEHEIRENFKYKGRAAYNSHIDIEVLWEWAESVDVRVDNRPEAAKNQRRE